MKCNSVIQYIVPMANLTCKKTCKKKKTYIGVSVELNQNRYNTKKLLGESIRTSEFLQEHFNVSRRQGSNMWNRMFMNRGKIEKNMVYEPFLKDLNKNLVLLNEQKNSSEFTM